MKILTICDSFKGTLSSKQIGEIVSNSLIQKGHYCDYIPISDGGEGFIDVISYITKCDSLTKVVKGPLFDDTISRYIYNKETKTCFIELSEASGITKVKELLAMEASTYGLGELIKYVILNHKPKKVVLGIGGSATSDMGCGMLEAMGVRFYDKNGKLLNKMNNRLLKEIAYFDSKEFLTLIKGIEFVTLSDVTNNCFDEFGTINVYAPQKGATKEQLPIMRENVLHFHEVVKSKIENVVDFNGAGAAGGVGYTMRYFFNSVVKSGIETILSLIEFGKIVKDYDIVISGEGRIDSQSLSGKVISGIKSYNPKRSILICGSTSISNNIDEIYSIVPNITCIEESLSHPKESLKKLIDSIKL